MVLTGPIVPQAAETRLWLGRERRQGVCASRQASTKDAQVDTNCVPVYIISRKSYILRHVVLRHMVRTRANIRGEAYRYI